MKGSSAFTWVVGDHRRLAELAGGLAVVLSWACTGEPLLPSDDYDAGVVAADAGEEHVDAGGEIQPDAGAATDGGSAEDAGTEPDAGTGCVFPVNEPVPFTCEGDEDFCDPEGDVPSPAGDILATWSRVEGDTFILDVRFYAAPFRLVDFARLSVLFERDSSVAGVGVSDDGDPLVAGQLFGGLLLTLVNDNGTLEEGYPPPTRRVDPQGSYDFCNVSLGFATPIIRFEVPLSLVANTSGTVRYAVQSRTPNVSSGYDVTWVDEPAFVAPLGGAPDRADDLVGICEWTCP